MGLAANNDINFGRASGLTAANRTDLGRGNDVGTRLSGRPHEFARNGTHATDGHVPVARAATDDVVKKTAILIKRR